MTEHVPDLPSLDAVQIDRQALALLALVDLTGSAMRVMLLLLAYQNARGGIAHISQAEVCSSLGLDPPAVNKVGPYGRRHHQARPRRNQLNPALTCGKTAGPVSVPPIKALDPESLCAARRERYEAQAANLSRSA
ncbi:hypothetical protein [Spirillospora sp. NPDC029432]|uniref:hypothetical protein n=1 Tax=Spirillospora sp. NPDC029432 TaxID=3154599 RepID=UPI00345393A6